MTTRRSRGALRILGLAVVAAGLYCIAIGTCPLLTDDQRGYRAFRAGELGAAGETFADPMWRGVALYRQGEFEQAAGVFAGFDTAEAAFNQGNALVMQGQYDQAVARYDRALELRPGWQPAAVNRDIAVTRAERLRREGGEGTGGMLGADEIVFSEQRSPPSAGEEQTEGGERLSDEELRSVWLRQVQTKPADFLRAKFAYQHAMQSADPENGE